MKGLFLLEHLLDVIILVKGEAASLLNNFVQMGDFSLKVLDDFAGFFFLLLGLFNKLPGFIDFALEDSDGVGRELHPPVLLVPHVGAGAALLTQDPKLSQGQPVHQ